MRHARGLNAFYRGFEARPSAHARAVPRGSVTSALERPVAASNGRSKALCSTAACAASACSSSTGMSCPMNCPKTLRNGPCGGVRDNGHCEVKPEMSCVWVEAFRGSERIPAASARCAKVQFAVDQRLQGRSSWLQRGARPQPRAAARLRAAKARHEVRGRTGSRLSAADPARAYLAGALRARAACAAALRSPPSLHPPDSADPEDVYRARAGVRRATSMPSTPPTAAAQTATCRASRCARC